MITFRKMIPEDADAVAELELKCFAMPWSRADFLRENTNELAEYIVGELDKKISPSDCPASKIISSIGRTSKSDCSKKLSNS